jgi:hypothetical protein
MPLRIRRQEIIILSEIHEHEEQQNEMSEVNAFLQIMEIFVILRGFE